MRTLRLSLAGTVILLLLGGLSGVVSAQSEEPDPMAPATAAIEITSWREVSPGTVRSDDAGVVHIEGVHHEHVWEATDPRLSGTVTYRGNWMAFPEVPMQVESATYEVVNEGGRWFGPATAQAGPSLGNTDTVLLRGEGGYEGLMAYVLMNGSTEPPKINVRYLPWRDASGPGACQRGLAANASSVSRPVPRGAGLSPPPSLHDLRLLHPVLPPWPHTQQSGRR